MNVHTRLRTCDMQDGTWLLSASGDKSLKLWNLKVTFRHSVLVHGNRELSLTTHVLLLLHVIALKCPHLVRNSNLCEI